jgi:hypothetical protein
VGLLSVVIAVAVFAAINNEKWAHNPWLIPVLGALLWGILQDRY